MMARCCAIVLAGVLAIVGALLWLGQQATQAHQAEMDRQRDGYLLGSLRTAAEDYLATGLQLEQTGALQGLIEREHAGFARVMAIDIFSAAGTVLYSTDTDSRGSAAPDAWRRHLEHEEPWRSEALLQRQIGQRFDNDLGQAAGGIVITLSTAPAPETLAQWKARGQQAVQWLALAALAGVAAVAGMAWGLRRLLRPYAEAARILQGGGTAPGTALAQAAAHRHAAWEAARQRCRQAQRQLEALDHDA